MEIVKKKQVQGTVGSEKKKKQPHLRKCGCHLSMSLAARFCEIKDSK
jgi:hypothetical protein